MAASTHNVSVCKDAIDVYSPLNLLFNKLFQPRMIKAPHWVKELHIEKQSTELYVCKTSEGLLYNFMAEVTHNAFLHFCNFLIFDRMKEFIQVRRIKPRSTVRIVITPDGVSTVIENYLKMAHFREFGDVHTNYYCDVSPAVHYRLLEREKRKRQEIEFFNLHVYNWEEKDSMDFQHYRMFLCQLTGSERHARYLFMPPYPTITGTINLRRHQCEIARDSTLWFHQTYKSDLCNCVLEDEQDSSPKQVSHSFIDAPTLNSGSSNTITEMDTQRLVKPEGRTHQLHVLYPSQDAIQQVCEGMHPTEAPTSANTEDSSNSQINSSNFRMSSSSTGGILTSEGYQQYTPTDTSVSFSHVANAIPSNSTGEVNQRMHFFQVNATDYLPTGQQKTVYSSPLPHIQTLASTSYATMPK
jgi:hypothetical protein